MVALDTEAREPEQEAVAEDVPFYEVTPDGLDSMLLRMRSLSFDNERLALGKVIVASSHLTAA